MPGFNQTGPMGQGSMTGRKMGRCTSFGAKLKKGTANSSDNQAQNQPEDITAKGLGIGRGRRGKGRNMGFKNRLRGIF